MKKNLFVIVESILKDTFFENKFENKFKNLLIENNINFKSERNEVVIM